MQLRVSFEALHPTGTRTHVLFSSFPHANVQVPNGTRGTSPHTHTHLLLTYIRRAHHCTCTHAHSSHMYLGCTTTHIHVYSSHMHAGHITSYASLLPIHAQMVVSHTCTLHTHTHTNTHLLPHSQSRSHGIYGWTWESLHALRDFLDKPGDS